MTYSSRFDWYLCAAIALTIGAVMLGANYWVCGPLLLVLLLCAYPQSYRTEAGELVIREALAERRIPYAAITSAAPEGGRVRLRFGLASQVWLAPADPRAFLADLASHTPHLVRCGGELVPRDRHVEYSFKTRRAYGIG